jgi:preprotein translocase subunit SecD
LQSTIAQVTGVSNVLGMPKRVIGLAVALGALAVAGCGASQDEISNGPCNGPGTGGPRVVYRAEPTSEEPRVTSAGIQRTIDVMCKRSRQLGAEGALIDRLSGNRIVVRLGPGADSSQTAVAVGIPARLAFYDWDSNVIGNPEVPETDLRKAVKAASLAHPNAEVSDLPPGGAEQETVQRYHGDQQRIDAFYDRRNNATVPSYYAFDSTGALAGGPEASCSGLGEDLTGGRRQARGSINAGDVDAHTCAARLAARKMLPAGAEIYVVPRGIRVVAAARPGGGAPGTGAEGTSTGWYVLEDDAALTSIDIDSAKPFKDPATGATGLKLTFTDDGAEAYRQLTTAIAQKGLEAPANGSPRLAIALDDQLLSLTAIDPQTSPNGLDPDVGAVVPSVGGPARAELLVKLIDSGPLPLNVRAAP